MIKGNAQKHVQVGFKKCGVKSSYNYVCIL